MNGVLLIDKKKGVTSRDVVRRVGQILGTKKVGHTGTLDPLATGVLVLCVGQGLKLVELMMRHDKEYIATIQLGIETDTLDITGNVLKRENPPQVSKQQIEEVLRGYVGKIKQEVPKYSAIKVNGKKLYEYARKGIEVPLPVHDVEIYHLELLGDIVDNCFQIKCSVSSGTYIRSLVRDIGASLGTVAVMRELRRTRVGDFKIENTYREEDVEAGNYQLLNLTDVLNLPVLVVRDEIEKKVRNGCKMEKFFDEEMIILENSKKQILAIYMQVGENKVKPYRMFV